MILIVGGAFQGKTAYAKERFPHIDFLDGAECDLNSVFGATGIIHFELFVKRWIEQTEEDLAEQLYKKNPSVIIVTTEIGYGIVPADRMQRNYRESVGRICTKLAGYATEVYRVRLGIGEQIK